MTNPKRVWSNNKTVWDGKKSVWLQDWELKTYDGNWEDAGSDLQTYWNQWEEVSEDAILDVYDSNTPEPIGTPEDGIEATYTFKDYDGTVLKTGKVKDGETPVAPADPTREHYIFQWWNPTVWPISKNTEFVAVYIPVYIPENYTFTINVENLPEGASIDNGEGPLEDFPIILDIPSWWSFNGGCNSHEGDGDLSVTIYDTPDWSSEWVASDVNISCEGYKPLFGAIWFNLEDDGWWGYNFKKDDNYQIVPDSNVSLTISFTSLEESE